MKPTKLQKDLAKLVQSQGAFWESTNDITSPTHSCDIDEQLSILSMEHPGLTNDYIDEFSEKLCELWTLIIKANMIIEEKWRRE